MAKFSGTLLESESDPFFSGTPLEESEGGGPAFSGVPLEEPDAGLQVVEQTPATAEFPGPLATGKLGAVAGKPVAEDAVEVNPKFTGTLAEEVSRPLGEDEDPLAKAVGKSLLQGALAIPKIVSEGGHVIRKAFNMPESKFRKSIKNADEFWQAKAGDAKYKDYLSQATRTISELGTAAAVGGAPAILPLLSGRAGAEKAATSLDEGYSLPRSLAAGATQAAVEYVTEKIPLGILQKPAMSFFRRLGAGMLTDVPGELAATAAEMKLIDEQILDKQYSGDQLKDALIDTLIVSGLVTGMASGGSHVLHEVASKTGPKFEGSPVQDAPPGTAPLPTDQIVEQTAAQPPAVEGEVVAQPPVTEGDAVAQPPVTEVTQDNTGDVFAVDEKGKAQKKGVFQPLPITPETIAAAEQIVDVQGVREKALTQITDEESREILEPGVTDSVLGEFNVVPYNVYNVIQNRLEKAGVPYVEVFSDGMNLGGANAKYGKNEARANEDLKKVWGGVLARKIIENGGLIGRSQGDEFREMFPNKTAAEVEILRPQIEAEARAEAARLGLADTPHPKYNGLPTGALGTNFGIVERIVDDRDGTLHKGEMNRVAATRLTQQKVAELLDIIERTGYNIGEEKKAELVGDQKKLQEEQDVIRKATEESRDTKKVEPAADRGAPSKKPGPPSKKKPAKDASPSKKVAKTRAVVKPVKATAPVASKPGKEFKGAIGDRVVKGPKPKAGTIKRREDILIPLLKALDQPVFQEAIKKGSTTLGDFLPEGHRIRTQSRSDLEVIAHEVAHLLDNTVYGGFKPGKNKRPWMRGNHKLYKTYRNELNGISYDKKMVAEGFAEFVRHWMTNTGTVDQATPEFNQYWEEFLASGMDGNPKIAKALLKAREEMSQWFAQGLTARMKSKIGEAYDPNVWTNTWAGTFRAAALDSMHGVLANELRLTGERGPQAGGMFETTSLTRAAYSQADGSIRYGPIVQHKDGSFSYNTEIDSLHDVLKDVAGDIENFKLYAISRSTNELKGQGRENRFTEGEIKAGQKLETPEFKKAFDKWLKFNNATLDFAESMGLISAEQRKGWRRAQYLPLFSVSNKTQRGGSKRPGEATVTKMLTGSTRNLNDIVDNMVMSTSKLIVMSIKNQAMRNVVDTTIEAPGGAKWIRKVPKVSKKVEISEEDISGELNKLNVELKKNVLRSLPKTFAPLVDSIFEQTKENLGEGFGTFFVHGQAPLGDNIIAVRRDGKLEYYQIVDDLLFRSFASMAAKEKGLVRQNLNTVRRLMQGTITTTFDFMGANLARDTLHGWVFSQNGFVPITDSVKGMNSRIKQDKTYQDWIANGGGMASYFIDEGALRKRMDKFLVKRGISPKSIIDTPRKFAWLIEAMGDATEASTRIGEFKKAVARGDNPRHAAYVSREISTDFAKRGDSEILGWMTDSIMFLNPAMQGLDRVYRGFTKDQNRGQIWAKSAMIATISVGLLLLNDDNDLYEGLDDFDKDGYWHFFIPVNDLMKRHLDPELVSTARDGREYLHTRMPKLWEIGAMASIAERTTKHIMDTIKKENPDGGAFAETVRNIMIDQMKFDLVPAAINPLLEQSMNKNRFTQRKIVNTGLERNLPWAQYSPHTSEIPRRIGALTRNLPAKYQISPARLQHLIQGYFNGWGYYGLFLTDNLLPGSRKASPRWDQFPVVKRFLEQHPRRTVFERDLFELLDESNKLEATFQKMQKNIILPTKSEFEDRKRLLGPVLRETSQIIKELRDAVNLARLDPNVSRDDLRKLEDKVQGEVSKLAEQVVKPIKRELRKNLIVDEGNVVVPATKKN